MAKSKKMTKRTKLALWLMIAPTVLIIAGIMLASIANWVLFSYDLLNSNALAVTINILTYLIGIIGFLTWLPGLIIGIVLLATPPSSKK
jgi:hypothetical protein